MLRGDLSSDPLGQLLADLAADSATGCLYLADPLGGETHVYLSEGDLDGVRPVPARDPLGPRLMTDGRIRTEQLDELGVPADDRAPSLAERLLAGELLPRSEFDSLALELALDTLDVACGWSSGPWRFRRRTRAALPLPTPTPVRDVLAALQERGEQRSRLAGELDVDPDALDAFVPAVGSVSLGLAAASSEPGARAVADLVDGTRDLGSMAQRSGRSVSAVARLLLELRPQAAEPEPVSAAEPEPEPTDPVAMAEPIAQSDPVAEPAPAGESEPASLRAEQPAEQPAEPAEQPAGQPAGQPASQRVATGRDTKHSSFDALDADALPVSWNRPNDDVEVSQSLAKASQALSEALGEGQAEDEPDRSTRAIRPSSADAQTAAAAPTLDPETAARRERLRAAAAAELAAAHAEAEEARRHHEASERASSVVDLSARREAARRARAERDARKAQETREAQETHETQERADREAQQLPDAGETAAVSDHRDLEPAEPVTTGETETGEPTEAGEPTDTGKTSEAAAAASSALSMLNEDPLGVEHLVPTAAGTRSAPAEPAQPAESSATAATTSATGSPAAASPAPPAARPWQGATEDHSVATALLREMAGDAAGHLSAPTAPVIPTQPTAPTSTPVDTPATGLTRPVGPGGSADTAALLRELSSLGDEGPGKSPSPGPRPSSRPSTGTPAHGGKRRKGLWGRS